MVTKQINVIKRNGTTEPLDLAKFHRVVEEACRGISGVSVSQIELDSQIRFFDGIKTSDIQETLITSAQNLISEETPSYQHVAGRLINYHVRKTAYGSHEIPTLWDHYNHGVEQGFYDKYLLDLYTKEEFDFFETIINHTRDFDLVSVAMEQFRSKYLVKNRVTGQQYETPQMAYMLIAMFLFAKSNEVDRYKLVRDYYDAISQQYITLPTPIMAGLRTPVRQFSSCVLIECGDSIDSITATSSAVIKYVSQKAGIGLSTGSIRGVNSPIRGGNAYHTGQIPILKLLEAAVRSCNAGGVRSGAATTHLPGWHQEFEDVVVLKNNKGTPETRVRGLDYSIQLSKLFYTRLITNGNITLFNPKDVPGLYEWFYVDQNKFEELYNKYEKQGLGTKTYTAREYFKILMDERKETGRIYIMNVDHVNDHGSFVPELAPVKMSNLCLTGDTKLSIITNNVPAFNISLEEVVDLVNSGNDVQVLSFNIETGEQEYKPVTAAALTNPNADLIEITDDNGRVIRCTAEHKIYTKNRGYVEAQHLLETDELEVE